MTRMLRLKTLIMLTLGTGIALLLYGSRSDISAWTARLFSDESTWFSRAPFPYEKLTYLYDLGIVDANGDGWLDIYTSNHNYRQVLLLADPHGGYRDVLSQWGLDQDRRFPGTEQQRDPPRLDRPGLYVYWVGDVLHMVLHETPKSHAFRGRLRFYNKVEVVDSGGFLIERYESKPAGSAVPVTVLTLKAEKAGHLRLYPHTRGTPITVEIDAPWLQGQVYLGGMKTPPSPDAAAFSLPPAHLTDAGNSLACRWCVRLEIQVRDRHALAWADYNGDGILDLFINRGALGGMLRRFPQEVRNRIGDELLLSMEPGRFEDRARDLGLEKKDCSARHARWVDYDRDGRLDLFNNCQDRGKAGGEFPKQFYRQGVDGRLHDVAHRVGLDLPKAQLIDMLWFDADGDGWIDLFTHEDTGFYLYRNDKGRFTRISIGRGPFHRDQIPNLKGETTDYWQFDGKLSAADVDADGDIDVLMTSKKGSVYLRNEQGRFVITPPARIGLPNSAVACGWIDYDNDSLVDVYCVPQGLYVQENTGQFRATNMLRLLDHKYQAALINVFDHNNDGRLDLLLALQDNAELWRWWEKPFKSANVKGRDDRFDWPVALYTNRGPTGNWLQVELQGPPGNPQAIGAHVTVQTSKRRQAAQVGAHDGAYSSQGHYRLYFGLGRDETAHIEILWPNGSRQNLAAVRANQRLIIRQTP